MVAWRSACSAGSATLTTVASMKVRLDPRMVATSVHRLLAGMKGGGITPAVCASSPPRCLDGGDVDLLHRHHRLERTLCLPATGRKRLGQRARDDLPGEAPAVLAPPALAFLAAIADDRVPVAVRLFLILRRD